ncbi:MAG: ribosome biogenesis GTPase Der [Oscillospiraceae bacterium]|jgi:GTP-binding protein|nr:ribosome biogenesis GTPase Der [Oscillospiraceae bacterium]
MTVIIVGRPNVGKSSLFNKLSGKRISIIHSSPGVTRDYVVSECEWQNEKITIIDTCGIEFDKTDSLARVTEQLSSADVIVFVTDVQSGVISDDQNIAVMLNKLNKPVILCVNKCDNQTLNAGIYEFYPLGFGEPIAISVAHGYGIGTLLNNILEKKIEHKNDSFQEFENVFCKIAILGKPNVGKSSLLNKICNYERSIVSDIPGTTRDSLDTMVTVNDKKYILTDTAGIRKNNSAKDAIEKYSEFRSNAAAERSDICIVMIDAHESVTEQDARIAGIPHNAGKACIILVNKWDKIDLTSNILPTALEFEKKVRSKLAFLSYVPIIFISTKTSRNIDKIFSLIDKVYENFSRRISTGMINNVLTKITFRVPPPTMKGKQLKIYYITQVSISPPTFVFFVNKFKLFHFSYQRYIQNRFRENFEFLGTPIKILIREKEKL